MELHGRSGREIWGWAVTALVVLGTAVFLLLQFAPSRAHGVAAGGSAETTPVEAHDFYTSGCPTGAPIPEIAYDLGSSFNALPQVVRGEECNPALKSEVTLASGPSAAVGYVSVTYGNCESSSSEGCSPPLTVQSWPECASNPESYNAQGATTEEGGTEAVPSEKLKLASATWIPAARFEGGTRIEIYTGNTTLVVFANQPEVASEAAEALAAAAAQLVPKSQAAWLRTETKQPGDASTCTHLLPASAK